MGSSLTWIAVKGATAAEVAQALGVRRTGRFADIGRQALVGQALPTGWFLVVASASDDRIAGSKTLAKLSAEHDVLACSIEEHVMASSAALWSRGERTWRIKHQGEHGVFHIEVESEEEPESFASLRDAALERQRAAGGDAAGVDHLFDVPLELAKSVVAFRHDEAGPADFEILEEAGPARIWRATRRWRVGVALIAALLGVGVLLGMLLGAMHSAASFVIAFVRAHLP